MPGCIWCFSSLILIWQFSDKKKKYYHVVLVMKVDPEGTSDYCCLVDKVTYEKTQGLKYVYWTVQLYNGCFK